MLEDIGQGIGASLALLTFGTLVFVVLRLPSNLYESPLLEIKMAQELRRRYQHLCAPDLSAQARIIYTDLVARADLLDEQEESASFRRTTARRLRVLRRFLELEDDFAHYQAFAGRKDELVQLQLDRYSSWLQTRSIDSAIRSFGRDAKRSGRYLFGSGYHDYGTIVIRKVFRRVSSIVTDWTTGGVVAGALAWIFAETLLGNQSFIGFVGSGAALVAFLGLGWSDVRLLRSLWLTTEEGQSNIRQLMWLLSLIVLVTAPLSALLILIGARAAQSWLGRTIQQSVTQSQVDAAPRTAPATAPTAVTAPLGWRIGFVVVASILIAGAVRYVVPRLQRRGSPAWEKARLGVLAAIPVAIAMPLLYAGIATGSTSTPLLRVIFGILFYVGFLLPPTLWILSCLLKRRQARTPEA